MLLAFAIVAGLASGGQESLARAKELYASAAYEDALKILDALHKAPPAAGDAREVAVYRVFCLLALERDAEAAKAIEAIVRADPMFRPSETQASPRLRERFSAVRTPLLPAVVRETYTKARESLDRGNFKAAIAGFDTVIALSKEIGPQNPDWHSLALGFRDLARAAADTEPAPPIPIAGRIYGPETPAVTPPAVISQVMPPGPRGLSIDPGQPIEVILELIVDQAGRVKSARIRKGIQTAYDQALIEAAVKWRFRPALLGGSPILYRHSMVIPLRH